MLRSTRDSVGGEKPGEQATLKSRRGPRIHEEDEVLEVKGLQVGRGAILSGVLLAFLV